MVRPVTSTPPHPLCSVHFYSISVFLFILLILIPTFDIPVIQHSTYSELLFCSFRGAKKQQELVIDYYSFYEMKFVHWYHCIPGTWYCRHMHLHGIGEAHKNPPRIICAYVVWFFERTQHQQPAAVHDSPLHQARLWQLAAKPANCQTAPPIVGGSDTAPAEALCLSFELLYSSARRHLLTLFDLNFWIFELLHYVQQYVV